MSANTNITVQIVLIVLALLGKRIKSPAVVGQLAVAMPFIFPFIAWILYVRGDLANRDLLGWVIMLFWTVAATVVSGIIICPAEFFSGGGSSYDPTSGKGKIYNSKGKVTGYFDRD